MRCLKIGTRVLNKGISYLLLRLDYYTIEHCYIYEVIDQTETKRHNFFQLFITTMSYSPQTSFNIVMMDLPDMYPL